MFVVVMTGREKVLLTSDGWGLLSTLQCPGRPHRKRPGPGVCVVKAEKPWSGAVLLRLECDAGLLGTVLKCRLELMRSPREGQAVPLSRC